MGLILRPRDNLLFEVFIDASFCGNWHHDNAMFNNPATAKSQTGFIIMYAGCPIFWKSCLQTLITLSITEAEFVVLSHAMHVIIPLMRIVNEMI